MKIYKINDDLSNVPCLKENINLCLGAFEAVHLAHQKLIISAKGYDEHKVGIITFANSVKGKELLTDIDVRLSLLKASDIDYVFLFPFNQKFKNISHVEFKEKFLDKIHPNVIFVGNDFTFGNNKKGNNEYLKRYYKINILKTVQKNKKKISSTYIADLLHQGKIKEANALLGRPYQIKGEVIKGYKLGRLLKFPTANVKILNKYIVPKFGVYKVLIYVRGIPHLGLSNVGIHPTVNKLKAPIIETYILNFDENIYKEKVYIEFIDFIREEKKFKNREELIEAINKDLKALKE